MVGKFGTIFRVFLGCDKWLEVTRMTSRWGEIIFSVCDDNVHSVREYQHMSELLAMIARMINKGVSKAKGRVSIDNSASLISCFCLISDGATTISNKLWILGVVQLLLLASTGLSGTLSLNA
ncbi:hypothetical protein JAAARDRAFT_438834 [Jaapia argillacea MUCL 33604]|uniref:Uncharacterized protein n=1 Tax=Jaapia argillacea MUCL 33604 TaxID=933084 RepID=A0A067PE93_9AGAM|nr:hypothetical protein JAAARDRAFT_438834 [Jaapia argillacea MUCL 33604]